MTGLRPLLLVTGGALLVSLLSVGASTLVTSPAQVAAEAAAPGPTLLTAVVEKRVLRDTVLVRGTVVAERSVTVTPAGARDGAEPVVTAVRTRAGATVTPGQVLLEVSGRPLISLQGAIPAYRDLRPGSRGKDVRQLQAALAALGHDSGADDGVFGAATKRAVADLYADLGYEPATTGDEDERALRAARATVRQAELDLARSRAGARTRASDATREAAQDAGAVAAALTAARAELEELEKRTGVMVPVGEVVFLPTIPARVDRVNGAVGSAVAAPLVVLSVGRPVVRATLAPADAALVKAGQRADIVAEALGVTVAGRVISVSGDGRLAVAGTRPLDPRMIGQDVRLTVESATTGRAVLVVPLAAVSATADGGTRVVRIAAGDAQQSVPVVVGASGDGYAEVRPTSGRLAARDRVAVGR
jgi:HlyD family secretion protein